MKTLDIKYFFAAFVIFFAASALKAQNYDPANWMRDLPDSLYICSLTIPGTYNAFTYNCTSIASAWAKAQTKSIEDQFKCGVRAFDVRPGYDHIRFSLRIQHGFIDCGYTFEDGMKMIEELVEGTKEFVVMFVNREGG